MRKAFWTVLVILFGFCGAEAKVVDRIYAQVNDDIITLSDINRRMKAIRDTLSKKLSADQLEQAVKEERENVLETLIEDRLLVQKAVELGMDAEVGPKVSSEIQRIMKEYKIESMEQLEDAVEQQGSNMEDFRENIRNQILSEEVINMYVRSRITMMDEEILKYYQDHASEFTAAEELSLSEIVITSEHAGGQEQAASRAKDLYNRLNKGESFKSLASQFSGGATANQGGEIGNNLTDKWHPDIIKAVAGLEDGEVSQPQKTKEGYVIYRVDKRKHAAVRPMEDVENIIKNKIYIGKYNPEFERYISRLKEEAYIQIYPETE